MGQRKRRPTCEIIQNCLILLWYNQKGSHASALRVMENFYYRIKSLFCKKTLIKISTVSKKCKLETYHVVKQNLNCTENYTLKYVWKIFNNIPTKTKLYNLLVNLSSFFETSNWLWLYHLRPTTKWIFFWKIRIRTIYGCSSNNRCYARNFCW